MKAMSDSTREAAKALGRHLGRPETRALFRDNGWQDDTVIVPAHEADTLAAVLARTDAVQPPVLVAVHFPDRPIDSRISFIYMTPSTASQMEDDQKVGRTSTIGMLADSLSRSRKRTDIQVGDWNKIDVTAFLARV